jgi:EAL domain-containing protein (putative c-di-GMP-specific phosphodiesterase class I)
MLLRDRSPEPDVSSPTAAPLSTTGLVPDDDAIVTALGEPGLTQRLAVHYRPVVSLSTGVVASIAARIRFTDPLLSQAPPKRVVQIAEKTGAIVPIGGWLIRESVHELAEILQAPRPEGPVGLSLKVSVPELSDQGFATRIAEVLTSAGVSPDGLVLEITHPLRADAAELADNLRLLRTMGPMLALDESSMGPEAIAQLRALRVGELRIAPEICHGAPEREEDRVTLTAIVGLARALGLVTVATGIQSAEQLDTARQLGVDRAQGALLGSPAPLAELLTWMKPR